MNVSKSSYQSVDGEFDLQSWNFQTQGAISLDGIGRSGTKSSSSHFLTLPYHHSRFLIFYTRAAGELFNSAVPSKFGTHEPAFFLQPEQMKER